MARMFYEIEADEAVCANCNHFHQHFVERKDRLNIRFFTPCNEGHCVFPRRKNRKPSDTCDKFKERKLN